jgi:hypothetical protein
MKLRVKVRRWLSPGPGDLPALQEAIDGLARARTGISRSLSVSIAMAGDYPSPDERRDIDMHFKLLGILMALTRDIEAGLDGTGRH